MDKKIEIDMTPFIYEDLETYYFRVMSRDCDSFTSSFSDLELYKVVKKEITETTGWWLWKNVRTFTEEKPILIGEESIWRERNDIKGSIESGMKKYKGLSLPDWDGFIGDIPEETKIRMSRNDKINGLLDGLIDEED